MKTIACMAFLLVLSAVIPAQAERISILDTSLEPPNSPAGVPRPRNSESMASVEAQYGAPEKKVAAIGDPPITRWIYKDYVVYFENDLVIHTVWNKKP